MKSDPGEPGIRLTAVMVLILLSAGLASAQTQLTGLVLDAQDEPVPFAAVWLLPDSTGVLTNTQGRFTWASVKPGTYLLRVSSVGYEPYAKKVMVSGEKKELRIRLETHQVLLEEVVIVDEHAKQEGMLTSEHLNWKELMQNSRGTFAQSLARLPGLDAINTGVGIAKPVIRGLSFNRVIVNDQGVKQEGQQWGADHGLEIDAFSVSRVEVLKGPASLQYGSDGLGGVINIFPDPIPAVNSVQGELTLLGKSNNLHGGASAKVAVNRRDLWLSARYSHQAFGDYRVPADTFLFQGFVLPIFDQRLKNTAGNEQNLRLEAGIRRENSISRITFSQYHLRSGLFAGAIGQPRSYALQPDGNRRNVDLPSQQVRHTKLLFNQTFFFGDDHLVVDAGYQQNLRQEFGYPEFHNQPEIDPANTLALQLILDSWAVNAHYEHKGPGNLTHIFGINTQLQHNRRSGWEFLLPDFDLWRAGAFYLGQYQPRNPRWQFSGGVRADAGQNQSEYFQRFVWNSNGVIVDSLSVPQLSALFANWSASLGMRHELVPGKSWLRAHIGKSFRIPYPSETSSNGVHHGTFRHEQGNPDLVSEQGYQLDLGMEWEGSRWQADVAVFASYFDNFIYLAPSGRLSRLPEAGQIFRYEQNDALYAGGEVSWSFDLGQGFTLRQVGEYVWNYNIDTRLALPFTPHPSVLSEIRWERKLPGSFAPEIRAALSHHYHFANGPLRVDRNERPTPAFQVMDAEVGGVFQIRNYRFDWSLQGQNLLNAAYLQHLSRYRLINVPEQGRNVVLALHFPFSA